MLITDTAIVLSKIAYNDDSDIVKFITPNHGLISAITKRSQSKKNKQTGFWMPLNSVTITFFLKQHQSFCTLKEITLNPNSVSNAYGELYKTNIKLFLGEVLSSVVKEHNYETVLFNFVLESIYALNKTTKPVANFHIGFLAGLINYLGVSPGNQFSAETPYFNIESGCFEKSENIFFAINQELSLLLSQLFQLANPELASQLKITNLQRRELLNLLVKYLDTHLHGITKIKSLAVLEEVFS
ncbi:MAG: recombination protein O N-terminal domain-containing protein [Bacteroidia bacterium]|nr:recombination protein O N-terminal domain-containing protein [Bacteroidia bacterium]